MCANERVSCIVNVCLNALLSILLCYQMMIGAEFVLKQSKMSASLDSNGKVDSALEVRMVVVVVLVFIMQKI